MVYIFILITLFIAELLYFKVADRFNIIDKPNQRSSHTKVTLRGGGIIFYIGIVLYFVISGFNYPWFFWGLTLMTLISFLDDIFTLSNKVRLIIHFISVSLMSYQLDVFTMPWYYLLLTFVIVVGVINSYNFMDGINGITACYSLVISGLLTLVNQKVNFVDQDLLLYTILGLIVFTFFNFRTNAKCFAGDVGSVAIAYILLFVLGLLILKTGNLIYILFLVIYGIDTVWTIIERVLRRENIFKAHRSHLYQILGNEAGVNKLLVSFLYAFSQFGIGLMIIMVSERDLNTQIYFAVIILIGLSVVYLIFKRYLTKKYLK
ncbi:UDP-GlcNAc--UDP-phosphate GlcNAc-1-phosphate transferase [Sphingobacterium sp.]|uniref:UDP-GlcNAc--UDP-phosphate GlcNAc-1-phosphate transferase n=1 Tax=Sphingobacterium sp. TaxID=341027 RepID=UPI00258EC7CE|nr:UDP-GlcNAc--UDP-phosphate GlcNAc-1-phosphate transferase [Sphingobacterium sp.]WET70806.1 MAG: UDP-GlcNAc--UDP-phosphate GlcNAc-1-phosphate transferase [Sphingobacterium sp.]